MDLSQSKHQSVRDYIAARKRGDVEGASLIALQVTTGAEAAEIVEASMTVPLGQRDA